MNPEKEELLRRHREATCASDDPTLGADMAEYSRTHPDDPFYEDEFDDDGSEDETEDEYEESDIEEGSGVYRSYEEYLASGGPVDPADDALWLHDQA